VAEGSYLQPALQLVGKRGRVVVTALGHPDEDTAALSLLDLTLYEKQVRGALFGSSSAQHDVPRLLEMANLGQLDLAGLVTREYALDEINTGYRDMREGRNIRGLIRY
jgi:S-(hydroxymethyl)glutathione dehydrogenase/alcohol dehydrogenase